MYYKLIEEMSIEELNKTVQDFLDNGWVLYGNPYTILSNSFRIYRYYQALTKQK